MKQDHFQWLVVILGVLLVIACGVLFQRQSQLMRAVVKVSSSEQTTTSVPAPTPTSTISASLAPTSDATQADGAQLVASFSYEPVHDQVTRAVQIVHRCVNGQIIRKRSDLDGKTYGYCLGKNQLVAIDSGEVNVLLENGVESAKDAPILMESPRVGNGSAETDQILISYTPEPCTTTGDCGAGMPNNHVTGIYNLTTRQLRALAHFPPATVGFGVWNKSLTKVLFLPVTCGGAGCEVLPLIGYNLVTDTALDATRERAVSRALGDTSDLKTTAGQSLSEWWSMQWVSDDAFEATFKGTDRKTQLVKGIF